MRFTQGPLGSVTIAGPNPLPVALSGTTDVKIVEVGLATVNPLWVEADILGQPIAVTIPVPSPVSISGTPPVTIAGPLGAGGQVSTTVERWQPSVVSGPAIPVKIEEYNRPIGKAGIITSSAVSSLTGTMAAALAVNGVVFSLANPTGSGRTVYVYKVRCQWRTVAAFTTPASTTRRLVLGRVDATGAVTGGTLLTPAQNDTGIARVAVPRIATTGTLTVPGFAAPAPIATRHLGGQGAAAAITEWEWDMSQDPWKLVAQDDTLVITNPIAMDAGGTWVLTVDAWWWET